MTAQKKGAGSCSEAVAPKIAVVLFNLGGPTGPATIYPFLVNFFMDPNIIPLTKPLRFFLARMIARRRSTGPAREAYGEMGGASPLLENTLAQAEALQLELQRQWSQAAQGAVDQENGYSSSEALVPEIRVYTCMRYWHPMADSVAPQVQAFAPDELVLLSLYPQMSSTTFWSSLTTWQQAANKIGYRKTPTVICCYPTEPGFIAASTQLVREQIEACKAATGRLPRVLFSAHSLPQKVIDNGDPYEWQCRQTAQAIQAQLNIPELDCVISYQSKVGPQQWLGPQTEDEIKRAGADNVPLIIYPHAFVSEHVETIVELGIEYREVAEHAGVPYYGVVPTVGIQPEFIGGLAGLVKKYLGRAGIFSDTPDGLPPCPSQFNWCCQRRAAKEHTMTQCYKK